MARTKQSARKVTAPKSAKAGSKDTETGARVSADEQAKNRQPQTRAARAYGDTDRY